jgi:hypothetical protein
LPFLRIVSGLNVGIEIDFINAGLLLGAWLGVPVPVRNSTWLSFSTARQRQTPLPSGASGSALLLLPPN